MHITMSANEVEMASTKSVLDTKEATVKAMVRVCDQLNYDLSSARTFVDGEERVIRDFAERVCTGYTSAMHALAGYNRYRLSALLTDVQLWCKYLGGYQVCALDDGHSLHLEMVIVKSSVR